jgi:uncharacterized protein
MRIWIDLENSPHSLFFRPIINELKTKKHDVWVTARDFAQTIELATNLDVPVIPVGSGKVNGTFYKAQALFSRTLKLVTLVRDKRIDIAVSHGARAQVLAAKVLGIKSYAYFDYDYSDTRLFHYLCKNVFVPEVTLENFRRVKKVRDDFFLPYPGIKEEVYIEEYPFSSTILSDLNLSDKQIIAVLRPPASLAHYANVKSDHLFQLVFQHLLSCRDVCIVILPRYENQRQELKLYSEVGNGRVIIPQKAVDAISLMAAADIVVSGGGTMVREGAVLGTPTYSVFCGPTGTIDNLLENEHKIIRIQEPSGIEKICVRKKPSKNKPYDQKRLAAHLVDRLIELNA